MSGHTPGPWAVELDLQEDGQIDVIQSEPVVPYVLAAIVCREHPDDDEPPREVALANARLIAAAPDLLGVLEEVSLFLTVSFPPKAWVAMKARVDEAIAKAEGR